MGDRKGQKAYANEKQQVSSDFQENFGREPRGEELLTYRLLKQQGWKCLYSGKSIEAQRIATDSTYVQIDHILPYSRSMDDSLNNKVVCLTDENQRKGNRTPLRVPRWRKRCGTLGAVSGTHYELQDLAGCQEEPSAAHQL